MQATKRCIESHILHRSAHMDVFDLSPSPKALFVLFGGSGVDEEEYQRRSQTVIPVFDPLLFRLGSIDLTFAYVSAPYDVPFNRFDTEPDLALDWNQHVLTELLQPWEAIPFFACSFSGGAALAFNGIHKAPRCFGGAVMGFDALPPTFTCPPHWPEKLRVYNAPNDRVCNHPKNQAILEQLQSRNQAEERHLRKGRHSLTDYATMECLGALIRHASHQAIKQLTSRKPKT